VRQIIRILFLLSFTVFASPILSAQADEIDTMVSALNEEVSKEDYTKFAEVFVEFAKRDARYGPAELDAVSNQVRSALAVSDVYGSYVSHSIVRKEFCGDRIARVIAVFFAERGQFVLNYWFVKSNKEWATSTFNLKGHGNSSKFFKGFSEILAATC